MDKYDTTTVHGRRELWQHVVHESHIEGHEVTLHTTQLMEKHINGQMNIDQVIQAVIDHEEVKY